MTFALKVASLTAADYMERARSAKAAGRQSVVAFYVRQARGEIRRGRRGEWGTVQMYIMGR
jgi:hypothetical protein